MDFDPTVDCICQQRSRYDGARRPSRNRVRQRVMEVQVRNNFRCRFWVELGLASIASLLALITPIFPAWLELVSAWDPDRHDGSAEVLIVVGLFAVIVVTLALAAMECREHQLRHRHQ
jgi:hypothetical protein